MTPQVLRAVLTTNPQALTAQLAPTPRFSAMIAEGVPGPAGPPGPPGPQGIPGEPGPSGQSAGKILYYAVSDASDIAGYKTLLTSPSAAAEQTIVTPCSGTSDVLVAAFATEPGVPGAVDYPAGTAFRRMYAMVDRGSARLHLLIVKRDAAGTETVVRDELSETFTNTAVALQEWLAVASAAGMLLATDRIVNKIYAQRVAGQQPVTVTTFYEGTAHSSHIQTTISAGAQGPAGVGVPAGGLTGHVLTKTSATDYATAWQAPVDSALRTYIQQIMATLDPGGPPPPPP